MNAYEQLTAIRAELENREARPKTLRILDGLISQAESERSNPMSVSQLMILRHILRSPAVLNDEEVYLDVLGLQGDLEEIVNARPEPEAAYTDESRSQRLHSYYKKQQQKRR